VPFLRGFIWGVLGVAVALGGVRLAAQAPVVDASDLHQPTSFDEGWLVQAGDNPAWADANFDDSHWHRFNARTDSLHTLFPNQQPDVVWYRLHITVAPHDTDLAIEEWFLSPAFELYSNGAKILQVGSVSPLLVYDHHARLLAKIPGEQIAAGNIVIAIRVHISRTDWLNAYPGLYYYNLVFGMDEALRQHIWLAVIGSHWLQAINALLNLGMFAGVVLLYSAQRRKEYLFLALVYGAAILTMPLFFYGAFHVFPVWWHTLDSIGLPVADYLVARTYLAFAERPVGWRLNVFLVLTSVINCVVGTLDWMNLSTTSVDLFGSIPFIVLWIVILPAILISAARRGNWDAGILLVPVVLTSFMVVVRLILFALQQIPPLRVPAFTLSNWMNNSTVGPFLIDPNQVAGILDSISMALIVLLRSNRQSQRQARVDAELESARAVQQMILPQTAEIVPGFQLESIYAPAQQVGGDFFQAIPDGAGGMLIVVGDVAGKGLPAALLVSILVGAVRTAAAYTHEPAEVLAQLNDRLLGRTCGGFSTAIAAHISADGVVEIANAGHLPPYLDGREVELAGALPLGIDAKAGYATGRVELKPGSRMVFYSDGVVEAQNAKGELLGFARAAELSTESVEEISQAAQAFGQSDDITVVSIARELVGVGAA